MPARAHKTRAASATLNLASNGGTREDRHPQFPRLTAKDDVELSILEKDQIIMITNLLSSKECKAFVAFIEQLPLELTPSRKRGEAIRVNDRLSIQSPYFARHLFDVLKPHLPELPMPASSKRVTPSIEPHSLNSNIRLYRYSEGQHFGKHYDDSVKDSVTGAQSEWTLLIYLTGESQGVEGGQTVFYREKKGKPTEEIVAPLIGGTALLHRHGHECMLHEGRPVLKGIKYVLRSDLMFKR